MFWGSTVVLTHFPHSPQVTWDGHSGSMARTQQAAQANITLQEQIEAIHKAKGLVQEDDTKEKIGPSKPNEIPQPPLPSVAPSLPKPTPPVNTVPRPTSSVSLNLFLHSRVSKDPFVSQK